MRSFRILLLIVAFIISSANAKCPVEDPNYFVGSSFNTLCAELWNNVECTTQHMQRFRFTENVTCYEETCVLVRPIYLDCVGFSILHSVARKYIFALFADNNITGDFVMKNCNLVGSLGGGFLNLMGQGVDVVLDNVRFISTTKLYDRPVTRFIDVNSVTIKNVVYLGTFLSSSSGACLYLFGRIRTVTVESSFFYQCASAGGSGILGYRLHWTKIQIASSVFQLNRAVDMYGGGSIRIRYSNFTDVVLTNISCLDSQVNSGHGAAIQIIGVQSLNISQLKLLNVSGKGSSAIFLEGIDKVVITDVAVTSVVSGRYGGCMYLAGVGTLTLTNVVLNDCRSAEYGAGLFVDGSDYIFISNITINNSVAIGIGGCLYLYNTRVNTTVKGANILNCRSENAGGGIFMMPHNNVTLEDIYVSNASSYDYAGGIGISGGAVGTLTLRNIVVTNCVSHMGAGIFITSGSETVVMENVTVTDSIVNATQTEQDSVGACFRIESLPHETKVYLKDIYVTRCDSSKGDSGAVHLYELHDVVTNNLIISNGFGKNTGGCLAVNHCRNVSMVNTVLSSCAAVGTSVGGGMFVSGNTNMKIQNLSITNARSVNGGCLYGDVAYGNTTTLEHSYKDVSMSGCVGMHSLSNVTYIASP
eukprot:PhF_6_TR31474/c0_g2_i1/m.46244